MHINTQYPRCLLCTTLISGENLFTFFHHALLLRNKIKTSRPNIVSCAANADVCLLPSLVQGCNFKRYTVVVNVVVV